MLRKDCPILLNSQSHSYSVVPSSTRSPLADMNLAFETVARAVLNVEAASWASSSDLACGSARSINVKRKCQSVS